MKTLLAILLAACFPGIVLAQAWPGQGVTVRATNGFAANPVFFGSWTNAPGQSNHFIVITNGGVAGDRDIQYLWFRGPATNRWALKFGDDGGAFQQVLINGMHSGGPEWQWTGDGYAITPGYWSQLGAIKDNRRFQVGSGENHRAHMDIFSDELADATTTRGYSIPLRFRTTWWSNGLFEVYPAIRAVSEGTNQWFLGIYSNFNYSVTGNNWTDSNQVPVLKINAGANTEVGVYGIFTTYGTYANLSNKVYFGNVGAPGIIYEPSTNPDQLIFGGTGNTETDILQRDSANTIYFKSGQNGNLFNKGGLVVSTLNLTNGFNTTPVAFHTNAMSTWPSGTVQSNGTFHILNSNGTPYIILSSAGSSAIVSTNPILNQVAGASVLESNIVINYFRARNTGARQSYNVGAAPVAVALSNWVNITSNNFTYNLGTGSITNLLAGKYRLRGVVTVDGFGGVTGTAFWRTNGTAAGAENEYVGAANTYSPHNLGDQEFTLPANCHIQFMMENTAGAATAFDTMHQTIAIEQVP